MVAKTCTRCGQEKPLDAFPFKKSGESARRPWCCACSSLRARSWRSDSSIGTWLLRKIKTRHKKYGPVTVSAEHLDALFQTQNGRCAYTGVELVNVRVGMHPFAPSVDRVDSTKGYEPDNVVICADCVNRMKNSMPADEFRICLNTIADSVFGQRWSKAA